MKSRLVSIVICTLMITTALPVSGTVMIDRTKRPALYSKTLYVGGSGFNNYTSIQDAINDASDGDTVFVYDDSSPYYENVVVDRSIILTGEDRETTIIDGSGNESVVYVVADWVSLSGFTIQNSASQGLNAAAIRVGWRLHTTISGNIISNNYIGIILHRSNDNAISNNTISNNAGGIALFESSNNNIVSDNTISNNNEGVVATEYSNNNTITGNIILNNGIGLGIAHYSSNNTASGNTISLNDEYGITLYVTGKNLVLNNTVNSNKECGILVEESNNTVISANNITYNGVGIGIVSTSSNNLLYHNNFIDNTQNAYDICSNTWDNGEEGNYWDDYKGMDFNRDGIGDTPYTIPGDSNQDRYPLMKPYGKSKSKSVDLMYINQLERLIERVPLLAGLLHHES